MLPEPIPPTSTMNSLRNRENGGQPVIASAPPKNSAPVAGRTLSAPRTLSMSLVPNLWCRFPAPRNIRVLASAWLSMWNSPPKMPQ